jgi:hypothetical protein
MKEYIIRKLQDRGPSTKEALQDDIATVLQALVDEGKVDYFISRSGDKTYYLLKD